MTLPIVRRLYIDNGGRVFRHPDSNEPGFFQVVGNHLVYQSAIFMAAQMPGLAFDIAVHELGQSHCFNLHSLLQ